MQKSVIDELGLSTSTEMLSQQEVISKFTHRVTDLFNRTNLPFVCTIEYQEDPLHSPRIWISTTGCDSEPVIEFIEGVNKVIIDRRKKALYKSMYELSDLI